MPHVFARIPYETIAEIRRRFIAGDPLKVIAIEEGVGIQKTAGFVADLPQQQLHLEAKRLKIIVCLDAGMGVQETAEKVDCPIRSVVRIIEARKRARPPCVQPEVEALERQIVALCGENARLRAVGAEKKEKQRKLSPEVLEKTRAWYAARSPEVRERRKAYLRAHRARVVAEKTAASIAADAIIVPAPEGLEERILATALPPETRAP